jgi:DNA mismatch repair protein MutL
MPARERVTRPVRELPPEVARKIAAGEVIDRPAAVVRELLDNAIDSGASRVTVEITGGGIEGIRIVDDGAGMTAEDLAICTKTHTTSKIAREDDLLALATLGFRGEALSSIQAVSRLEITTTRDGREAWRLEPSGIVPARLAGGTIVQVTGLFANFPARRQFLKRPAAETSLCKQTFLEKALPWHTIEFRLSVDGTLKSVLPPSDTLLGRCLAAFEPKESESFFHEIAGSGQGFTFRAVLGNPDVRRNDRRELMVFVNGRRIMEYGLLQAIEYGAEGHFPNGAHPFGLLFVTIDPALVDFNIHPAKREARFRDPGSLHHAVSSAVRDFYRRWTVRSLAREIAEGGETEFALDDMEVSGGNAPSAANPAREAFHAAQGSGFRFDRRESAPESGKSLAYPGARKSKDSGTDLRERAFSDYRGKIEPYRPMAGTGIGKIVDAVTRVEDNASFRYIGQVLGTFLAVEREGIFYLIDQHAAHERILFEGFRARRGETQELLVPYRIETDSAQADRMLETRREALKNAGFSLEDEGSGIWQVTAVPAAWSGSTKDLEDDILDPAANPDTIADRLWATAACRAACKDGDALDDDTARSIAARAFALEEPVCPHGRPIWVAVTREELFARVRRT